MIEAALRPKARLIPLAPVLEERYDAASWRGRSRGTRTWLMVVALINLLCIGVDVVVMPAHWIESVATRVPLSVVYAAAAWLLGRRQPGWIQGLSVGVPAVGLILVAAYLGALAGGAHAERYYTAAMFATFAATIVPNIPFRYSVILVTLSIALFAAMLLRASSVSIGASFVDSIEFLTYYPVSVVVALDVRRWMERMHRRNFLLALRDELRVHDLAAVNARLTTLSNTDPLTGVFNRRFFDGAYVTAWRTTAAADGWIGVMMIDVDFFKSLNDVAGHVAGDRCLQAIAAAVRGEVRAKRDLVARYGGEEFVAILEDTAPGAVAAVAERARAAVERLRLPNPGRPDRPFVTVSVGFAVGRAESADLSPGRLLQQADAALYAAKAAGRNCVRAAGEIVTPPPLVPDQEAGPERSAASGALTA